MKTPTRGASRPRAGSPAFVSVFVFVLIYGFISFIMNHIFYYDVKSKSAGTQTFSHKPLPEFPVLGNNGVSEYWKRLDGSEPDGSESF